jgi:hypothetical protein
MSLKSLRKEFVELWYFICIPAVAALLPWKLAWRWLRWWALRESGPFDESARAAWAVAPQHLPIEDGARFRARMRLLWLIDYTDLLLSAMRRRRSWYPWHVQRVGEWPRQGGFIAAGFHAPAYWLFRMLAESNHDCMTISVRWERKDFIGHPVRYWHGRLRYWDMRRLGRQPIAYRPGVKDKIKRALADGAAVLSLVDVPPRMAPNAPYPVRLLDHDLSFTEGVVAIAREANVPIVPFWVEFDEDLRTRKFCIGEPLDASDPAATLSALAQILDRQVRRMPESWFFWPELPRWIADATAVRSAAATPHESQA